MKELLQQLIETRAREVGELQKFVGEAEKRAVDNIYLAEDKEQLEKRTSGLNELESRIKLLGDSIKGDAVIDGYRSTMEPMLRPDVQAKDELENDWLTQEKRLNDFFTIDRSDPRHGNKMSMEISLRGLHIDQNQRGQKVVHETRSLKSLGTMGLEQRTGLVDGTNSAGGFLFGPSFRTVLYQHLIFNAAIMQTRATVLTTGSGENLLLPKTTAHPAAGTIVSEASAIGESDPAFGQATLNAYKYGNIVNVSTELEQDTQVDLLGYLAKIMGTQLGNGFGAACVTGTGSSQPQGVLVGVGAASGTVVTGGTPAASGASFAELEKVYDAIIPPYQLNGEWFLGQAAFSKVRSLTNTQGTPIFIPTLTGDQPDTIFGKRVVLDPNMPSPATAATSIAFGDFSTYFIRQVDGVRFERSVDYQFGSDQVSYRALLRADGRLLDLTGAISVYKGGTA